MMQYKGYLARVDLDSDAKLLHGEVVNIRDVVTVQAKSVAFCAERGEEPDRP